MYPTNRYHRVDPWPCACDHHEHRTYRRSVTFFGGRKTRPKLPSSFLGFRDRYNSLGYARHLYSCSIDRSLADCKDPFDSVIGKYLSARSNRGPVIFETSTPTPPHYGSLLFSFSFPYFTLHPDSAFSSTSLTQTLRRCTYIAMLRLQLGPSLIRNFADVGGHGKMRLPARLKVRSPQRLHRSCSIHVSPES